MLKAHGPLPELIITLTGINNSNIGNNDNSNNDTRSGTPQATATMGRKPLKHHLVC